jgi:hypothetical protein
LRLKRLGKGKVALRVDQRNHPPNDG